MPLSLLCTSHHVIQLDIVLELADAGDLSKMIRVSGKPLYAKVFTSLYSTAFQKDEAIDPRTDNLVCTLSVLIFILIPICSGGTLYNCAVPLSTCIPEE